MLSDLQDIICAPGPAHGSIRDLRIARVQDISSLPRAGWGSYANPEVVFKTGKTWTSIHIAPDQGSYREAPQVTPHGTHYDIELLFNLIRLRGIVDRERAKMQDGHYIAEFTDNMGLRRRVGSLASPLRITSGASTTNTRSSAQGYDFRLYGVSRLPAVQVASVVCGTLGADQFAYEWKFDQPGDVIGIYITHNTSRLIHEVHNWPPGEFRDENGTLGDYASYSPYFLQYRPDTVPVLPLRPDPGYWELIVNDIPVTLTNTQQCNISIAIKYPPPPPSGAFDSGFSSGFDI